MGIIAKTGSFEHLSSSVGQTTIADGYFIKTLNGAATLLSPDGAHRAHGDIISGGTLAVASNQLKVADGGIQHTQLHTNVAGSGLTGGGGAALAVQVSGAVLVNADKVGISGSIAGDGLGFVGGVNSIHSLKIADGGVDTDMIGDDQVTLAKMASITKGQIIYGDASGDPAYLAAGADNKVLGTTGAGVPAWISVDNDMMTNSSLTIGSTAVSLGGTQTAIDGLTQVTTTAFTASYAKITNLDVTNIDSTTYAATELEIVDKTITVSSGAADAAAADGAGLKIQGAGVDFTWVNGNTRMELNKRLYSSVGFTGNGAGLSDLNGGAVNSGVVGDAYLDNNRILNTIQTNEGAGTGLGRMQLSGTVISTSASSGASDLWLLAQGETGQIKSPMGSLNLDWQAGLGIPYFGGGEITGVRQANIQNIAFHSSSVSAGPALVIGMGPGGSSIELSASTGNHSFAIRPKGTGVVTISNIQFAGQVDASGSGINRLGDLNFTDAAHKNISSGVNKNLTIRATGSGHILLERAKLNSGLVANNQSITEVRTLTFNSGSTLEIGGDDMDTMFQIKKQGGNAWITFDSNGTFITVMEQQVSFVEDLVIASGKHFLPAATATSNLGSDTKRWANIYTSDLNMANERGSWRLIEESSFLSLRNEKTGKRYKFDMTLLPEDQWDPDNNWVAPDEE